MKRCLTKSFTPGSEALYAQLLIELKKSFYNVCFQSRRGLVAAVCYQKF